MKKYLLSLIAFLFLFIPFGVTNALTPDRYVFDEAGILSPEEVERLEQLAKEYSVKNETDFIIITRNDGQDIEEYMKNFADERAVGYGTEPNGNAAMIGLEMENRDVKMMGFEKAEEYIDNNRFSQIYNDIKPALAEGRYYDAFQQFILTADEYMQTLPESNNILHKWWFQIGAALLIACIAVGSMVYNSGGRVTVNSHTYLNQNNTRINSKRDVFVNQTVTKVRKPSNKSSGGGGVTGGGRSFSGGGGKF